MLELYFDLRISNRHGIVFGSRGLCLPDLVHTCQSQLSVVKVSKSIVLRIPSRGPTRSTMHVTTYRRHTSAPSDIRLIT